MQRYFRVQLLNQLSLVDQKILGLHPMDEIYLCLERNRPGNPLMHVSIGNCGGIVGLIYLTWFSRGEWDKDVRPILVLLNDSFDLGSLNLGRLNKDKG
jgi:hypothetical protein